MGQRIRNIFQERFAVIWIAAMVFFVGFVPQLRADAHTGPNESSMVGTDGFAASAPNSVVSGT